MKSFFFRSFAAISIVSMALPWVATASTNQEILDQAFKNTLMQGTPLRTDVDVRFSMTTEMKGKPAQTNWAHVTFWNRVINAHTNEGRASLENLHIVIPEDANQGAITLDQPVALRWKYSDKKSFLQLENLPQSIMDWAKNGMEVDLTPTIKQWIFIETSQAKDFSSELPSVSSLDSSDLWSLPSTLNNLKKYPVISATRVEKRWTDTEGHDIIRFRTRLNPAFIEALRQFYVKAIDRKQSDWRKQTADLNKAFNEIQMVARRVDMAINVDQTTNMVNRMEMNGKFTKREKTKTLGFHGIVTVNFQSDSGAAIDLPQDAITFEELGKRLQPSTKTPSASPLQSNMTDSDKDGLTDEQENVLYKTNPMLADTDGDGYQDREEIESGYNPLGQGICLNPTCLAS